MKFSDFFTFEKFVAPTLIKFVYWIGLFLIALSTLAGITGMSMFGGYGGGGIGGSLVALLVGAMFALLWRVVCEVWIVFFSMNDRLGVLVGQKDKTPGAPN
jgi:hypothetical protein